MGSRELLEQFIAGTKNRIHTHLRGSGFESDDRWSRSVDDMMIVMEGCGSG